MARRKGNGSGIDLRTRDTLRAVGPSRQSLDFIPAFAVRRSVEIPGYDEAQERIKKRFKRELPGTFRKELQFTPGQELSISSIVQNGLVHAAREFGVVPSERAARKTVRDLHRSLFEQVLQEPSELKLVRSSKLQAFGSGGRHKQVMGVLFDGFRGTRMRYETHDDDGIPTPFAALVSEVGICRDAVSAYLGRSSKDCEQALGTTPHVSIVRNKNGIPQHLFGAMEEILDDELPEEVLVGKPVLSVSMQAGSGVVKIPCSDLWPGRDAQEYPSEYREGSVLLPQVRTA